MRENGMTISELAKLMQVSVHQIRYFEEKGVLLPAYIGDNQYRMYGIDEVYRQSVTLPMYPSILTSVGRGEGHCSSSWPRNMRIHIRCFIT